MSPVKNDLPFRSTIEELGDSVAQADNELIAAMLYQDYGARNDAFTAWKASRAAFAQTVLRRASIQISAKDGSETAAAFLAQDRASTPTPLDNFLTQIAESARPNASLKELTAAYDDFAALFAPSGDALKPKFTYSTGIDHRKISGEWLSIDIEPNREQLNALYAMQLAGVDAITVSANKFWEEREFGKQAPIPPSSRVDRVQLMPRPDGWFGDRTVETVWGETYSDAVEMAKSSSDHGLRSLMRAHPLQVAAHAESGINLADSVASALPRLEIGRQAASTSVGDR